MLSEGALGSGTFRLAGDSRSALESCFARLEFYWLARSCDSSEYPQTFLLLSISPPSSLICILRKSSTVPRLFLKSKKFFLDQLLMVSAEHAASSMARLLIQPKLM